MFKSYKTELNPTEKQIHTLNAYFKICVVAYNRFTSFNLNRLSNYKSFVSSSEYLNLIRKGTINDVGSELFLKREYAHAVAHTLENSEKTFRLFFSDKSNPPKLKKIGTKNISLHFSAKDAGKYYIPCERHRILIPYIGWIRIKEKGYIPCSADRKYVVSGCIKRNAGRYFVSALVEEKKQGTVNAGYTEGIGIDLNVNNFAYLSNGMVFENINKTERVKDLKKKLSRECRKLSGMQAHYGKMSESDRAKCTRSNYHRQSEKINRIYYRLESIRRDYVRKCIKEIVDLRPEFIAVEDLSVMSMVSDKRFAKFVSEEMFYEFRLGLFRKCKEEGIEFRVINKWIPSSKMCHECGFVRKKLSPDEREYVCPSCGVVVNRDYNASLNIRDALNYEVWH